MNNCQILAINPGSTSTKIGIYRDDQCVFSTCIHHSSADLSKYQRIADQLDLRKQVILFSLAQAGFELSTLNAIVARGGLLKPISGGTYRINQVMVDDLKQAKRGNHASNLGALIADDVARELAIPAFIVDPVVVDELEPLARFSGLKEIDRPSTFHALNQRAMARKAAQEVGREYEQLNLLIAHLGGGISVGVHRRGRVIDVNNALDGDGPFSPERTGSLPIGPLMSMCFHGGLSETELYRKLVGSGGLVSYLGTNDAREVERMIDGGDEYASQVYQAMAYQVAKEIGAGATVLAGEVDLVVLTGGLAQSDRFVQWIIQRVQFIAPVSVYPGENELEALALGALRVLKGQALARDYI